MDIEVVQPFRLRDELAVDFLWSSNEYPRAVRTQPLAGMCIAAMSGLWMLLQESGGVGTFIVAFVFFWGVHLIIRYPLIRLRNLLRLILASRWRLGVRAPDIMRFHDYGYIWNIAGEISVVSRWSDLTDVIDGRRGILIRCADPTNPDQAKFLYVRKDAFQEASDYRNLRTFLRDKLRNAAQLMESTQ